jgi:hypothetical protein
MCGSFVILEIPFTIIFSDEIDLRVGPALLSIFMQAFLEIRGNVLYVKSYVASESLVNEVDQTSRKRFQHGAFKIAQI